MLVMNIMEMMGVKSVSQNTESAPNTGGFAEKFEKAVAGTGTFKEVQAQTAAQPNKTQNTGTVKETEGEDITSSKDEDTQNQDRYVPFAMIPIMSVSEPAVDATQQPQQATELNTDIIVDIDGQASVVISKENIAVNADTAVAGNVSIAQDGQIPAGTQEAQVTPDFSAQLKAEQNSVTAGQTENLTVSVPNADLSTIGTATEENTTQQLTSNLQQMASVQKTDNAAVQRTNDNTALNAIGNANRQTADNATQQVSGNTAQQVSDIVDNTVRQAFDSINQQATDNAVRQSVDGMAQQVFDNTAQQTIEGMIQQSSDNTAQQTPDSKAQQSADVAAQQALGNVTPELLNNVAQASVTGAEAAKNINNLAKSAKENEKLDDTIVREMLDETASAVKQNAVADGYKALETARPAININGGSLSTGYNGEGSENTGYTSEDEPALQTVKGVNVEIPAAQPQSIFSRDIQLVSATGEQQAPAEALGVKFQIIEQVKTMVSDAKTELTLQLKPHHLGGLSITLTSDQNGITAKLVTASKDAHMLIQSEMAAMQEVLRDKGVHVVEMEVIYDQFANTTGKGDSNGGNGSWAGQRGQTGGNQGGLRERTDNVVMMYDDISGIDILAEHGGSVEFSA